MLIKGGYWLGPPHRKARAHPWCGEDDSSEEMITGMGSGKGGIQKQVDVWVENEDVDVAKVDTRSNNSVSQDRVAQAVGILVMLSEYRRSLGWRP